MKILKIKQSDIIKTTFNKNFGFTQECDEIKLGIKKLLEHKYKIYVFKSIRELEEINKAVNKKNNNI